MVGLGNVYMLIIRKIQKYIFEDAYESMLIDYSYGSIYLFVGMYNVTNCDVCYG